MAIIKLCRFLVDILCKISTTYRPYVTTDKKGIKQFLVRFQNALYVTMLSSPLNYCKFNKILTDIGF